MVIMFVNKYKTWMSDWNTFLGRQWKFTKMGHIRIQRVVTKYSIATIYPKVSRPVSRLIKLSSRLTLSEFSLLSRYRAILHKVFNVATY